MQNLHRRFDWHYIGQIYGGDFAKFCGLLRIYELYNFIQILAFFKNNWPHCAHRRWRPPGPWFTTITECILDHPFNGSTIRLLPEQLSNIIVQHIGGIEGEKAEQALTHIHIEV